MDPAPASYSVPGSARLHGAYSHPLLRDWQCEHAVDLCLTDRLIYPIFVTEQTEGEPVRISGLPGQSRWPCGSALVEHLRVLCNKGLRAVIVFGVPSDDETKDAVGTYADHTEGPTILCIKLLRKEFPALLVVADVCLCEYTDHGHCGILEEDGSLHNAKSCERISAVATAYAAAGAHVIAPSDMMDGRIGAIRASLESNGLLEKTSVMSYAAKFASCLYGPFREAANSAPSFGDRRCYQLPPGSRALALRALERDVKEGADIVMVKPGGPYADIVRDAAALGRPVAAYQVSGEAAMLVAAARDGAFDVEKVIRESLLSLRRAGASVILTYFVPALLTGEFEVLLSWKEGPART